MVDALEEGEVYLLLKSMFVTLSDERSVKQIDIDFLKEISSMGEPFNNIDFKTTIDRWANSYNTEPKTFFQDFIRDLRGYKLSNHISELFINLDINILEQCNLTYERLAIIKTIRSQIECTDSKIPAYRKIRNIPLPFEYVLNFKAQFGIDDSTFAKIANEHFSDSNSNVLEVINVVKNHNEETCTDNKILKKRKWWRKLIGTQN